MSAHTYLVPGGVPSPYPQLQQIVLTSRRLDAPASVEVYGGEAVALVRDLKRGTGDLDI